MFRIIYANDQNFPYGYYRVMSRHGTLEDAKAARKVTGDVVVDDEGSIVTDRGWLFDWELEPEEGPSARNRGFLKPEKGHVAYALKCIQKQENLEIPYLSKMKQFQQG